MYEKYREIRDSKGLRDADVAKATGVGKSVFSEWKAGRSTPKIDKMMKIADFLEVDVYRIIGRSTVDIPVDLNDLARSNYKARELFGYLLTASESDWDYVLSTFKMLQERDEERNKLSENMKVSDSKDLPRLDSDLEEEYKKIHSNSASRGVSSALNGTGDIGDEDALSA